MDSWARLSLVAVALVASAAGVSALEVPRAAAPPATGASAARDASTGLSRGPALRDARDAALAAANPASRSAPREAARVYQQRTPEGGVLLTDRPLDDARTERTWAMEREDPDAARERSDNVSREAQRVSERVQRRIDRDQQIARNAELDRQQAVALADADRRAAETREERYGVAGYGPLANRPRYRQPLPSRGEAKPPAARHRSSPILLRLE